MRTLYSAGLLSRGRVRAVSLWLLATAIELLSEAFHLAQLPLSWSFGKRGQTFVGPFLSLPTGVLGQRLLQLHIWNR